MQLHQKSKFENRLSKRLFVSFLALTFVLAIIGFSFAAQNSVSDDELNKELKQMQDNGALSQNLIDKIPSLNPEQKEKVISGLATIPDKQKFWDQWNSNEIKNKNSLLKDVSLEGRKAFFKQYGDHYGIKMTGFAENFDKGIAFGSGGIVGNNKFYFDSEQIRKQNSEGDQSRKITEVEYKSENGKDSSIVKKQDGSSATIVTGKDMNGYFFDARTSKLYSLKDSSGNLVPDEKNPLSGEWNGRGALTIDLTGKEKKLSLDFTRDKNGKPEDTNFAKFTNANGESYSNFLKPNGKKDSEGNILYDREKAEISFNAEGKASVVSNAFYDGTKYGGYFGKDVNMFYNKDDYAKLSDAEKSKLGSYLIVDEKNKYIRGDVARTPGGPIPGTEEYAKGLKDYWAGKLGEMDKAVKGIDTLLDLDKKNNNPAEVGKAETKQNVGWMDAALNKAKDLAGSAADTGKAAASSLARDYAKGEIAKALGLSKDNPIVTALSTNAGLKTIEASIAYARSYATIAEGLSSAAYAGMDSLSNSVDAPLMKSMLPAEGAFMNVQLKNDLARNIENVNLRGGSLEIQDSSGQFVRVVDLATPYSYKLNSNFNKNDPSFEGINFNLVNNNVPDQQIQIVSDSNGDLRSIGVGGLSNMAEAGSISLSGTGTAIIGNSGKHDQTQTNGILSASLSVSSENLDSAKTYLDSASKQYADLYNKYKADPAGITPERNKELIALADDITLNYYQKMKGGDMSFSVESLSPESSQKFSERVNEIADKLDAFTGGKTATGANMDSNDPTMQKLIGLSVSKVLSDYSLQDQLVQRGLTSSGAVETALRKQASDISQFLRSNTGGSFEFVSNSKNQVYQIKYGDNVMNLDPVMGAVVSDVFPMIAGSGGVRDDGSFYIDNAIWSDNRFSGQKTENFYGETYHGLRGLILPKRRAQNEPIIKAQIQSQIQGQVEDYMQNLIKNPGYSR